MRSKNFGIASNAAKIFRQHFASCLPFPGNLNMQCRFTGAIAKWLGTSDAGNLPAEENLGYISGFAFNAAGSTAALLKLPLTVTKENDQLLRLHIPAFVPATAILAPEQTLQVIARIAAASWNRGEPNQQKSVFHTMEIPYNNLLIPAQDIPLALPASRGCLILTILSLQFIHTGGEHDSRTRYCPCNVIDARYC